MIFLKSIAVGLLASIVGAILAFVALVIYIRVHFHTNSMSFDISPRSTSLWLYLALFFLAGFALEFYKLQAQTR